MIKGLSYAFKNAAGAAKQALVHSDDRIETYNRAAKTTTANLAADTVISATAKYIDSVNVTVAGSTTGAIHNCATVLTASAANLVSVIPAAVGHVSIHANCDVGIVYIRGNGQTISPNIG